MLPAKKLVLQQNEITTATKILINVKVVLDIDPTNFQGIISCFVHY